MNVMIGVDPHKASHTAVAIGRDEGQIASVKVRATLRQVDHLLTWAEPFEKRTWAIESVGGLGYLLAQQLVARGEDVVDVPATLAARIRVLATKRSTKTDPTMLTRSPLPPCGPRRFVRSSRLITPKSSVSFQNGTGIWAASELGWSAACTRSSLSSLRAELQRKCTYLTPRHC